MKRMMTLVPVLAVIAAAQPESLLHLARSSTPEPVLSYGDWMAGGFGTVAAEAVGTPADDVGTTGWALDGAALLIVRSHGEDGSELALVSAETGAERTVLVLPGETPTRAVLSPDGRYVAYDVPAVGSPEQRDVFVAAVSGGAPQRVLHGTAANERLVGWAPKGDAIEFELQLNGAGYVWRTPVDEGRRSGGPVLVGRRSAERAS